MVRELPDADLDFMELEHYPGMTGKALQKITAQARVSVGLLTRIYRSPGRCYATLG